MTDFEIIRGNDEICRMLLFESDKPYIYKIPNLFPHEKLNDTGFTEFSTLHTGFNSDWNMLIGAYNRALNIISSMPDVAILILKEDKNFTVNFGVKNFFSTFQNQLSISSCWIKLVDFARLWNSLQPMISLNNLK